MQDSVEPRNLQWGNKELCTDEDGDEYLCHRRERQTKTRVGGGGNPKDIRKFKPKFWNNKDKKISLETYKRFNRTGQKKWTGLMSHSLFCFFVCLVLNDASTLVGH